MSTADTCPPGGVRVLVHQTGIEPVKIEPLLRRVRLPVPPLVHKKYPPCYALQVGLTGLPVGVGAARGSYSHAHAVRGAHPALDAGSCATYKIPGSARTDALCLLWVPISRLPGRFHFALSRAKLAYKCRHRSRRVAPIYGTARVRWGRVPRRCLCKAQNQKPQGLCSLRLLMVLL